MTMDLKALCQQVIAVTRVASDFIQSQRGKITEGNIEEKGLNDFVTFVDKGSEKILVEGLQPLVPNAGFIAEENTSTVHGEKYNWIIDPLDGTTNFIHGIPCYCISIALKENDRLILGVVYEINQDECFYAWEKGGAFLNGKPIRVSSRSKLKDALLATGFPYYDYRMLDAYLKLFAHFMQKTHGLRRLGSAAADMAYVAAGRFEGFYEYGLKAWDVAGGTVIIREAGGMVTDFKGEQNFLFGQELICSNSLVFNELQENVARFMVPSGTE